jgi:Outer membrane protein beta-barrel domain
MHTTKGPRLASSFLLLVAFSGTAAHAQTDIALNLDGAFSSTATAQLDSEDTPSNSAGGMLELRHIRNPFVGYEATYSFNRANQVYAFLGLCPAHLCPVSPVAVSATAQEITGDWVFSARTGKLRPFALAGAGFLLTDPTSGQSYTQSSNTAVYVYGAGLDWRLRPHLGLRLQYRGNVYKTPDLNLEFSGPGAYLHTAEPMIGVSYSF